MRFFTISATVDSEKVNVLNFGSKNIAIVSVLLFSVFPSLLWTAIAIAIHRTMNCYLQKVRAVAILNFSIPVKKSPAVKYCPSLVPVTFWLRSEQDAGIYACMYVHMYEAKTTDFICHLISSENEIFPLYTI